MLARSLVVASGWRAVPKPSGPEGRCPLGGMGGGRVSVTASRVSGRDILIVRERGSIKSSYNISLKLSFFR